MTELSQLLNDLEQLLGHLQRPVVNRLRPGLPVEEVQRLASSLGLTFPQELRALFHWHDGLVWDGEVDSIGEMYVFPGYFPLTLEEGISHYKSFLDT